MSPNEKLTSIDEFLEVKGGGLQYKANYHIIKKIHIYYLELCITIQQILNCSIFLSLFNAVVHR